MYILCTARVNREIREKMKKKYPDFSFSFHRRMTEDALKELPQADILLTYGEDLNDERVEMAKNLKWIMVLSAGLDKMPFEAIKKKEIIVTNARGIHKIPMAEYTLSMMLQVARKSKRIIHNEENKNWDRSIRMTELADKTVAIIGTGAIGSEIARLAKAFRMRTIGVNRSGREVDHIDDIHTTKELIEVLRQADFIVSVLPSTTETSHIFSKREFQAMKDDAVFINIGRGSAVDEGALKETLDSGELGHAVLDVFETEPLPENHPFWEMENVTVTPHISGISPQYHYRSFEIFEKNLHTFLKGEGEYENLINLDRGY